MGADDYVLPAGTVLERLERLSVRCPGWLVADRLLPPATRVAAAFPRLRWLDWRGASGQEMCFAEPEVRE